jgi:hypothetical protein
MAKRTSRLTVETLAVLLLGASWGCGGGEVRAQAVTGTAEAFLQALKDGRWEDAYRRLYEPRQDECGSATRLGELVEAAGERPAAWVLREPQVRKRTALVTGQVIKTSGASGIVELAFDQIDEQWTITAWSASNRELCRQGGTGGGV